MSYWQVIETKYFTRSFNLSAAQHEKYLQAGVIPAANIQGQWKEAVCVLFSAYYSRWPGLGLPQIIWKKKGENVDRKKLHQICGGSILNPGSDSQIHECCSLFFFLLVLLAPDHSEVNPKNCKSNYLGHPSNEPCQWFSEPVRWRMKPGEGMLCSFPFLYFPHSQLNIHRLGLTSKVVWRMQPDSHVLFVKVMPPLGFLEEESFQPDI